MLIRHFIPLAIVVVALLSAGAEKVGVPVPPVTIIATFASILLLLQLENHKIGDAIADVVRAFKEHRQV